MAGLITKRKKDMVQWTLANIKNWPEFPELSDADPQEIRARFVKYEHLSSLPVLECLLGGGCVTSIDWFYWKKKQNHLPIDKQAMRQQNNHIG